jgi:hypothetical protein
MTTEPQVSIIVEFRDGLGRTWVAAGVLGPLVRHEGGKAVESMAPYQTKDKEMAIMALKVVEDT